MTLAQKIRKQTDAMLHKEKVASMCTIWCKECNREVAQREAKIQRGLKTVHYIQHKCDCADRWRGTHWLGSWVLRYDIGQSPYDICWCRHHRQAHTSDSGACDSLYGCQCKKFDLNNS